MKKLTALTLVLLCVVLIFSSCGGASRKMKKTYDLDWEPENRVLTAAQDLGITLDSASKTQINIAQTLLAYRQHTTVDSETRETLCVFSTFTDTVLKTIPIGETKAYVHFPSTPAGGIFSILYVTPAATSKYTKNDDFDVHLHDDDKLRLEIFDGYGNMIASYDENELNARTFNTFYSNLISSSAINSYLSIDRVCYFEEGGKLEKAFDLGFKEVTGRFHRAKDCYYVYSNPTSGHSYVRVYDEHFECIYYYEFTGNAQTAASQIHFLQNGDFIIQYHFKVEASEGEYTYRTTDSRYRLVTQLHEVRSQQVKILDLDYVINEVYNAGDEEIEFFNPKIENVASITRIDPDLKMCLQGYYLMDLVELSNDGKIGDSLKLTPYQLGLPTPLGNGLYKVYSVGGECKIFDRKGDVVFTYSDSFLPRRFGSYLYNDTAIYDLYGNLMFDLEENDMIVEYIFKNTALLKSRETARLYLFRGKDDVTLIGEASKVTMRMTGYEMLETVDGSPNICYYNVNGERIAVFPVQNLKQAAILMSSANGIVMQAVDGKLYKLNYVAA